MRKGLLFIDFLVVMIFSLGGIAFHEVEGSILWELFRVSLPFLIGMLMCGWGLGAYDEENDRRQFVKTSGFALIGGLCVSFFLRFCQRGIVPPLSFIIASFVFFFILTAPLKMAYWKLSAKG